MSNTTIHTELSDSLTRIKPLVSLGAIFREWLLIAFGIGLYLWSPYTYPIVWLLIGTRMYALYSLLHDGLHYLILPSKRWNDVVTYFFLAIPLFSNLKTFRKQHFAHHTHLLSKDDPEQQHLNYPEYQFPFTKIHLLGIFVLDLTGMNYLKYQLFKILNGARQFNFAPLVQLVVIIGLSVLFYNLGILTYVFLLWIFPFISIYQFLNRVRFYSEHLNFTGESKKKSRTLVVKKWLAFFVVPNNLGYHAEHHGHPNVPFYHLPALHSKLIKEDKYMRETEVTTSYLSIFSLLLSTRTK